MSPSLTMDTNNIWSKLCSLLYPKPPAPVSVSMMLNKGNTFGQQKQTTFSRLFNDRSFSPLLKSRFCSAVFKQDKKHLGHFPVYMSKTIIPNLIRQFMAPSYLTVTSSVVGSFSSKGYNQDYSMLYNTDKEAVSNQDYNFVKKYNSCTYSDNFTDVNVSTSTDNFAFLNCIAHSYNHFFTTPAMDKCKDNTVPVKGCDKDNLQHVLYERKGCVRKGRPSSKKQRKRKREKQRNLDKKSLMISHPTDVESSSECHKLATVDMVLEPSVRAHSFAARLFQCEESDTSDTEDTMCSDDSDWEELSDNEGFDNLFPLETCVAKEIQTESVTSNSVQLSTNLDSFILDFSFQPDYSSDSDDDSEWDDEIFDDDIEWSDKTLCDYVVTGSVTAQINQDFDCLVSSTKTKSLEKINAAWQNIYSNSNYADSKSTSKSSSVVHFASDANLITVYEVENIMAYFIDRERFKRRIQHCEQTLSHIFSKNHRQQIFERNRYLM